MTTTEIGPAGSSTRARNPWLAFAVLAAAQFLMVLDVSVVLVALPSVQGELGFSQTGLAWVMNAYILAFGGFLLLGGRAADVFGHRRILLAGMAILGVTSIACAVSAAPWQLVAARGGQGLSAAIACPAAMALVFELFSSQADRNKALAIFGSVGGLSGAIGSPFGGLLTAVGWQWVFLFNVPAVIIVVVLGMRMLPSRRGQVAGGMDVTGSLAVTGGLCALIFAVLHGGSTSWTSGSTLTAFVVAAALLAAFAVRQVRASSPLIPRALFRLGNVVVGNIANLMTGALLFGIFFVLTLHLQQDRGYEPLQAAVTTMPVCLALFLGAQALPRVLGRIAPVPALAGSLGLIGLGLVWWASALSADANVITAFVLPGMVWSFGTGASIVAGTVVCTTGVDETVSGAAAGLVNTTLQVGGAVGVAVFSTIAVNRSGALTAQGSDLPTALTSGNAYALAGGVGVAVLGVLITLVLLRRRPAASPVPEQAASTAGS